MSAANAKKSFTQSQMESIAAALGDTDVGLTGSEIEHLLTSCRMADASSHMTKRHRLYNAFVEEQNKRKDRRAILGFIRKSMKPERYLRSPERFEPMRSNLNGALAFVGMCVDETGELKSSKSAQTLSEAQRRAKELRADLVVRGVHPDVLSFCNAELLTDDFFHAVLEAVKSVADKIRTKTGLVDDGNTLIDRAFSGDTPMLAINDLSTPSQKSEQKGFANLLRGTFGMFRNPTAHEARIHWNMTKEDAEDLLSLVSLIHRRLDLAIMPPRY